MHPKAILLFTGLCFFFVNNLFSQGSLQFNQVLNIKSGDGTLTVPANKVWKVERVVYASSLPDPYCTSSTSCGSTVLNDQILLDGTSIIVRSFRSRGDYDQVNTVVWEETFPLWLNAGKTLAASTGVFMISIVEFNIIP